MLMRPPGRRGAGAPPPAGQLLLLTVSVLALLASLADELAPAPFAAGARQPMYITGISNVGGSVAGGNFLEVQGSGFPDQYEAANGDTSGVEVRVGGVECPQVHYYSSANKYVCVAPPGEHETDAEVTVHLKGDAGWTFDPDAHSICCYHYHWWHNNVVSAIRPDAVAPGETVELTFHGRSWMQAAADIGSIMVGGVLCEYESDREPILGEGLTLECTLGSAEEYASAWQAHGGPTAQLAGVSVTQSFDGEYPGSRAMLSGPQAFFTHVDAPATSGPPPGNGSAYDGAAHPRPGYARYDFEVHPRIDGIHPRAGSPAGGQRLTITGVGFPYGDGGDGEASSALEVSVTVGETPCDLESAPSPTQLVCVTRAATNATAEDASEWPAWTGMWAGEAFRGARGVLVHRWEADDGAEMAHDVGDFNNRYTGVPPDETVRGTGLATAFRNPWHGGDEDEYGDLWMSTQMAIFTAPYDGTFPARRPASPRHRWSTSAAADAHTTHTTLARGQATTPSACTRTTSASSGRASPAAPSRT